MEIPQWLKDWGPGAGGALGGTVAGGWLGTSIGSIFGEDTWFSQTLGILGSIVGGIGGWLAGNAIAGRNPTNPTEPTTDASADLSAAIEAITADVVKTREAFEAYVIDKINLTSEQATALYAEIDALDGNLNDGINPSLALPKITERIQAFVAR